VLLLPEVPEVPDVPDVLPDVPLVPEVPLELLPVPLVLEPELPLEPGVVVLVEPEPDVPEVPDVPELLEPEPEIPEPDVPELELLVPVVVVPGRPASVLPFFSQPLWRPGLRPESMLRECSADLLLPTSEAPGVVVSPGVVEPTPGLVVLPPEEPLPDCPEPGAPEAVPLLLLLLEPILAPLD
jgi:hypothetical protein